MEALRVPRSPKLLAGLVPVLAALALVACGGGEVEAPPRPAIVVQPQPATAGLLDAYAGSLRARHESALAFRVGGKVSRRLVDVGDRVRAGQVLAELDRADLDLEVAAAAAALASAEADAQLAASELARHDELHARRLISQSTLDVRRNADAAAKARVRQAQSRLAAARNAESYAALRAPAAGVVTQVAAEIGQVIAVGTPVVTVAQTDEIEALIHVPEGRVGAFRPGLPARVVLWAERDLELTGQVREVAPEADPRTRTYDVRVTIADLPKSAQLGMTARVMLAGDASRALGVPLSAVTEFDGRASVWRVDPARLTVAPVPVEIAMWGSDAALLAGGVETGDWIVAVGVHQLTVGQEIRPIDRRNRPVELR